ncbi:MAG: four helix bundle protein [Verrucomicrobia bacterium]|nr:four helix bundle protein [Verrucomicrobiota bacterium]
MTEKIFDLEERLLEYAAEIIRLVESLPQTRAGNHVAGQLLRSGTSPLPNHGEAQAAESRNDFIHKLSVCLKELKETRRWLRLAARVPLVKPVDKARSVLEETEELIRIFAASIRTAKNKKSRPGSSD